MQLTTPTPFHLQENLIYRLWVNLSPAEKLERKCLGLPTPKPTKGEKLLDEAEKYLESKGYEHADLGMYFPNGFPEDHHGIGLAFPDHAVAICFVDGITFERSNWIDCTTKKQAIELIDLLLFALSARSR